MNGLWVSVCFGATAGVVLLFMGWKPLIVWADANPSMAAWVQAIGSVLAILAAVAVAYAQAWQAQRQAKQQLAERQHSLRNTALLAVRHLSSVVRVSGNSPNSDEPVEKTVLDLHFAAIANALAPIETFPVWDAEDPRLVRGMLHVARSARVVMTAMRYGDITLQVGSRSILDQCNKVMVEYGQVPHPWDRAMEDADFYSSNKVPVRKEG